MFCTSLKRRRSSFSRVNSLTSSEPETDSVSSMSWFSSSDCFCDALVRLQRFFPTILVGISRKGMMAQPTNASRQSSENMAIAVLTTVRKLLNAEDSVLEMTTDTPEISVFIRVMMSPCRSVVKKA